jgi:hypothetical protein
MTGSASGRICTDSSRDSDAYDFWKPAVAERRSAPRRIMRRLLIVYLVLYYAVIAGAVVTVWRSGLIAHFERTWTFLAIAVALALGGLLAVLSRK